jgi:hypothetical protein
MMHALQYLIGVFLNHLGASGKVFRVHLRDRIGIEPNICDFGQAGEVCLSIPPLRASNVHFESLHSDKNCANLLARDRVFLLS